MNIFLKVFNRFVRNTKKSCYLPSHCTTINAKLTETERHLEVSFACSQLVDITAIAKEIDRLDAEIRQTQLTNITVASSIASKQTYTVRSTKSSG